MVEYFITHWYLLLVLIALIVLTVFVSVKAYKAASRTNKQREAALKKAEYEARVMKEYRELSSEKAGAADARELLDGTALNIQRMLEKESQMEKAFENLSDAKKTVYALYYFLEDVERKGLSEFFKCNGKPLTPWALNGARKTFSKDALKVFEAEYEAFDPDNETASNTAAIIEKLDNEYKNCAQSEKLLEEIKKYICTHIEEL